MRVRVNFWNPLILCAIGLMFISGVIGFYRSQQQGQTVNSAGINEQLNFQARLLDDTGAVVPDGFYNLRFKVYQDGDGCEVSGTSPCSGTLEWTETRVSTDKVRVKNGYFSVYLGSVTPFGNDVDWNQDTLWLSIDVGGTASPSWDGEMLPFTRFSATPYAKNAKKLGGLSKDELIQLGQASLQVDSTTNGSIGINKTGATGDILKLQRGGSDVLVLDNAGYLLFKPQTDSVTAVQVKNATGLSTIFSVDTSNKRVGVNSPAPTASLQVTSTDASFAGLSVQGASGQTANLQEWQDSTGAVLTSVSSSGAIRFGSASDAVLNRFSAGVLRLSNAVDASGSAGGSLQIGGYYNSGASYRSGLVLSSGGFSDFGGSIQFLWQGSNSSTLSANADTIAAVKLNTRLAINTTGTVNTNTRLTVNSPTTEDATVLIGSSTAGSKGLVVRGATSQTANLQEWQNDAGSILMRVASNGYIYAPGLVSTGTPASSGFVRLANAENIAWRNAANSADYTFGVNSSNQLVSTAPIWVGSNGAILYGLGGSGQARTVLTYVSANEYLDLSSNGSVKLRLTSSYGAQFGAYSLTGGTNEKLRVNTPTTVDNLANTIITASATTAKPLVIQGLASQTANLQEWQSSTGTVLSAIAADGDIVSTEQISVGNQTPLSGVRLSVYTNTDVKGLVVRGSGSQTANLQEWQNSSGTVLGSVKSDGSLVVGSGNQYLSAANLTVRGAGAVQSAFIQTATSSSTGGSGIIGIQDDGAATSSGDRLGYILLGGAYDASNNAYHSAGITAFASQDFASGSGGSELRFEVMPNNSATRTLRVAIPQDLDGFTFGSTGDVNLYRSGADLLRTDDSLTVAGSALRVATASGGLVYISNNLALESTGTTLRLGEGFTEVLNRSSAGRFTFGTSGDTNLYRSSANILTTDGSFRVQGGAATDTSLVIGNGGNPSRLNLGYSSNYGSITSNGNIINVADQDGNTSGNYFSWGFDGSSTTYTEMMRFSDGGQLGLNATSYGTNNKLTVNANNTADDAAAVQFNSNAVGRKGLVVQGFAGQTANLQEWQNSAGTVLASVGATGNTLFNPSAASVDAFRVQSAGANVLQVDTAARSGSGGNLVKVGNSTGTDSDTTILQLDAATADPTSNLSALNGGLFYDSTLNKVKIIENGVVKTVCNTTDAGCGAGGSGARLDQVTAATTGASINNADNNVVWNWQLTAAESGFTFTENAASTGGGTQDQFITDMATLTGSTASPLRVTSASVDAADVVFNLASAGDIEFQDNGTAFMTLSDAGAYTYTLDATDNPAYTITNNGSGNVVTNLAGTGDFIVQDNGTAVLTIADSGEIDTALTSTNTTASDEYSLKVTVSDTGVVNTGTDSTYGQRIAVTRTGATGGTINSYGLDILNNTDNSGAGTATAYGINAFAGGASTGTNAEYLYGIRGGASAVLTGGVTMAVGVRGEVASFLFGGTITEGAGLQGHLNLTGGGTLTDGYGLHIQSASISSSTITSNYGVFVEAQTNGTSDYGVAIEAADTQTLWLSSNANNTTASAGIAFGSSRDTTLYRSDVATLKTDGTFQVGSASAAGQIDLYGDLVKKGITKQTGLTGITDVHVYDTTKDSDTGAWTNSPTSQSLSWYTETKNDGFGDACNIASDTRCGSSGFPKKAIIVSTTSAVYIFDANDYKMFMKFNQNAAGYAIGVDTNNDPSSVFALNGVVYVGANGASAGGMYAIDFTQDRMYNYNTTDRDQGDKNIANRNTAVTYNLDSRTALAIRHNAVNAVHGSVLYGSSSIETNGGPGNGKTFIAAATDDSISVVNLSEQKTLDYGDNLTDQFSAVYVTKRGRLYGLNVTLSQVERYGTQANGTVGIDVAKADQATPSDLFDEAAGNLPNVANGAAAPTFAVGAPDALKVVERASMADDAADLLYVGHSAGLTEVHDVNVPSGTVIGWSKHYNTSRETSYMTGTQRGMFSFDNLSGDLTDSTIRNSVLEPEVAPTYGVNGVHGTGLRFNGTSQFLCSDANNDGTCDTDADFNVAALSFSVSAWFRHSTAIAGTDVLIDKRFSALGGTEGAGYTVEMNSSGSIVFGIQDTAATAAYDDSVTSTQTYNDGQWHHVAAVNTDTGLCLYIDGKQASTCDTALAATLTLDASQILTIGADGSGAAGGNFWDGDIDDVYFSGGGATVSDTLTQAQIRKIYLEGRGALAKPSTVVTAATTFSSTTIGDSAETYVPNSFVGSFVEITAGTGAGQSRRVIANDGTTLTVSPAWTVTPSTDSDYEVIPEKLYGDTNIVTSIGLNNTNFLGSNPDLYVGTSNGTDGGAVSVFSGYANAFVSNVYHSDTGVTDSSGASWTGADADDIDALSVENGIVVMGSSANLWLEKSDRNLEQDMDRFFNNISSIRGELIVDGMAGVSSEVGGVGGADLAERFTSFDSLVPGDIVSMQDNSVGEVVPSSKPYDDKTLGIVATNPGLIIGPQEENSYPIALSGRVPVKVLIKPGESIKSGDRITSSTVAGYGMKAVGAGRVVGTVLEDLNTETLIDCPDGSPAGARCGTVMVFVNLVDYNGQRVEVAMEEFGNGGFTMPDTVLGPLVNLQEGVLADKLKKSDDIIRYLIGRKQQQAPGEDNSEILTDRVSAYEINGVSINAKDITADSIKANKIEGLEVLVGKLTSRPKAATEAGGSELTEASVNLDDFVVKTAKVGESLTVEGALFANGALKVVGPVEFLNTSVFHRMATFVDSVIFRNDVEIEGRLTQNNDAAGFATIYKTQKKVVIKFEKPYDDTPVVTVNIKNGKFAQFAYDDLTKEGFTIILPEDATQDIEFAWTAVSVKDAKTIDVPVPPVKN